MANAITATGGGPGPSQNTWTLGVQPGIHYLTIKTLLGISLELRVTATPPGVYQLAIASGDGQTAPAGTVLPLVVQWSDGAGHPGPVTTLTWTVTGGGSMTTITTTTDGLNELAANHWTLGPAGTQTVTVSEPGGSSVTFTATIQGTGLLGKASGDLQSAPGGTGLTDGLVVSWAYPNGNAGPVTTLTWTVTGGGSMAAPTTMTDGNNNLDTNYWTLGPAGTPQTCTVSEPGGSSVTFTATAT